MRNVNDLMIRTVSVASDKGLASFESVPSEKDETCEHTASKVANRVADRPDRPPDWAATRRRSLTFVCSSSLLVSDFRVTSPGSDPCRGSVADIKPKELGFKSSSKVNWIRISSVRFEMGMGYKNKPVRLTSPCAINAATVPLSLVPPSN